MIGADLIAWISASIAPLILVAARLGGLAVFAPIFGSQVVNNKIKVFFFLGLAAVTVPVLVASGRLVGVEDLSLWQLVAAIALEITIGALIGFIALMPMMAMQTGGLVMAQQMGLGFARFYNPAMGDEADVLENLLFLLALVTFIAIGGIDWMVLAVLNSYEYIAVGVFVPGNGLVGLLTGLVMASLEVGLRVAAPLLALVFLETLAIGFISKTVPQLNILSLGFPIRIMVGLATIIVGVVVLQEVLIDFIDVVLVTMQDWIRAGGVIDG
ncbi:MAG: flagellar biosynthetic protein FliR [Phycisphaerales bacterium]|nr:flagellar biosynthetic protein FliR [Phycisphaerales bacterium]